MSTPVSNKIALFIDGANLYATAKTLGFDIDYKRLLKEFQGRGTLLRAFYYTAIIDDQSFDRKPVKVGDAVPLNWDAADAIVLGRLAT